ncbi:MAG: anti-sigma factor [Candidatus Aminicenantes bacterium]
MKCDHMNKLLSPYLDRELSHQKNRELEKHLRECPECSGLLSHMREARSALSEWPQLEVSSGLRSRLLDIGPPQKKVKPFLNLDFWLRPSLQPAMAAFTIIMTLISLFLLHPGKERIEQSLDRQFHIGYSKIQRLYVRAESHADFLAAYKNNFVNTIKNINLTGVDGNNGG